MTYSMNGKASYTYYLTYSTLIPEFVYGSYTSPRHLYSRLPNKFNHCQPVTLNVLLCRGESVKWVSVNELAFFYT